MFSRLSKNNWKAKLSLLIHINEAHSSKGKKPRGDMHGFLGELSVWRRNSEVMSCQYLTGGENHYRQQSYLQGYYFLHRMCGNQCLRKVSSVTCRDINDSTRTDTVNETANLLIQNLHYHPHYKQTPTRGDSYFLIKTALNMEKYWV